MVLLRKFHAIGSEVDSSVSNYSTAPEKYEVIAILESDSNPGGWELFPLKRQKINVINALIGKASKLGTNRINLRVFTVQEVSPEIERVEYDHERNEEVKTKQLANHIVYAKAEAIYIERSSN